MGTSNNAINENIVERKAFVIQPKMVLDGNKRTADPGFIGVAPGNGVIT